MPCAHLRPWIGTIGIVASYTLLTTLLFLPILPAFTSAILVGSASGVQDGWQNVWNLWWIHSAVARGQNPFHTTMLFYPTGVDLFWQTLNAPHGLLALPITALATPMAAYTAIAFVSFVAGGYTMYLLAWRLTGARTGAWIVGCLFAFAPIHMTKLVDGQLELLCVQYIPLFILSLYDAIERARWRSSILGGILLVVMILTSLYYGLFSLIYLGVYAIYIMVWKRDTATLRRIVAHTTIVCLPAAIVLLPQLVGTSSGAALEDWQQRQALHAATPLDMILPSPYSILWGSAVADIQSSLHPGVGGAVIASGAVTLLLAALGMLLSGAPARRWAVVASVLLIFALGPYLVIDGRVTSIPLPFLILDQLPAVKLVQPRRNA